MRGYCNTQWSKADDTSDIVQSIAISDGYWDSSPNNACDGLVTRYKSKDDAGSTLGSSLCTMFGRTVARGKECALTSSMESHMGRPLDHSQGDQGGPMAKCPKLSQESVAVEPLATENCLETLMTLEESISRAQMKSSTSKFD